MSDHSELRLLGKRKFTMSVKNKEVTGLYTTGGEKSYAYSWRALNGLRMEKSDDRNSPSGDNSLARTGHERPVLPQVSVPVSVSERRFPASAWVLSGVGSGVGLGVGSKYDRSVDNLLDEMAIVMS